MALQKRLKVKRGNPLQTELQKYECNLSRDEFREILAKTFRKMYPEMTDEAVLADPQLALDFCQAIQKQTTRKLPNTLILRALVGLRKSPDSRRR